MPGFAPISAAPISALPAAPAAPAAAPEARRETYGGVSSYQRGADQVYRLVGIPSEERFGTPAVFVLPAPPGPDWRALALADDVLLLEDFDFVAAELMA